MRPVPAGILFTLVLLAAPVAAKAQNDRGTQTCVDVQIGSAESYNCLTQKLRRAAEQARPPANPPGTLSVTSPPSQLGNFDQSATAERMGKNFGHSVHPQRPPPVIYSNPLVTGARP